MAGRCEGGDFIDHASQFDDAVLIVDLRLQSVALGAELAREIDEGLRQPHQRVEIVATLLGLFVLLLLLDLLENARLQLLQFAQFLEIVSHFGGDFGSYADWAAVRSHGGRLRKGMVNHADNWLTPS